MLRHIVIWSFKDRAGGADKAANVARAQAALLSFAGLTPGILQFEVATPQAGLTFNGDLMLNSAFADRAALEAYQKHPEHAAIKPFMSEVVQGRHCMDYEI